jgi:hypothetical protein
MRVITFLVCIISLSFTSYSQDCHIPSIDYHPKEIIGGYSLYQFTPNASPKTKDSLLLITGVYDSIESMQLKIMYADVHSMASAYKDPGVDRIKVDSNRNVLSRKTYSEGKTYDGKYKYVGLNECTYNDKGALLSESFYGTSNIPLTFVYADTSLEQVIKQNYSHRASPDCITRYIYKEGLLTAIESYKQGALAFRNVLSYTAGNLTEAKAYKPDGTLFSIIEFNYSGRGFTQTLYFYTGQGKDIKKLDDSYYWKYTKDEDRIVEIECGKNGSTINKNKYAYDARGRISVIKMYDTKSLKFVHKYYYE